MVLTATMGFEEGCTILSCDEANAFNRMYRKRFLPAVAEIASLGVSTQQTRTLGNFQSYCLYKVEEG